MGGWGWGGEGGGTFDAMNKAGMCVLKVLRISRDIRRDISVLVDWALKINK